MAPGSVVVDLAAERGGNCALTRPDEIVVHKGVTILGPSNPPARSRTMPARCIRRTSPRSCRISWARTARSKATLELKPDDEITRETLLTQGGQVVHPRVKELLSVGAQNR